MARVDGADILSRQLATKAKVDKRVVGKVIYTQEYAIHVHENTQVHHPVGQAKFLEQPYREMAPRFGVMMRQVMKNGGSQYDAVTLICLMVQAESQRLCPVDTGALRNSAAIRVEVVD